MPALEVRIFKQPFDECEEQRIVTEDELDQRLLGHYYGPFQGDGGGAPWVKHEFEPQHHMRARYMQPEFWEGGG